MAEPAVILPYLAEVFKVPVPKWEVCVRDLPRNVLALYDPDEKKIYFKSCDPPIWVIAHEFGHHLHTVYGVRASRRVLEEVANEVERRLSEFYGVTPPVYGYPRDEFDKALSLVILFLGFLGVLTGARL